MSNFLQPHGLYSPWNFPGQITGVGSGSLLQGIFPTQGLNPGVLHFGWILYQLSHQGKPRILEWLAYHFSSESSLPRNWTRASCITGRFFTSWATGEAHSDFGAQENKVCHCFYCFLIYSLWSDRTGCHDLSFLNTELQADFLTLLFQFHQEAPQFFFAVCHKGGIISISEVIDISPRNLDSSLCFIQPGIFHDILCI